MPDPISNDQRELLALEKVKPLLEPGSLFHNMRRFPTSLGSPKIDRLESVLTHGLLALNNNTEVDLSSDVFIGGFQNSDIPYYDYVFVHLYNPNISYAYTFLEEGKFMIFLSSDVKFLTVDELSHEMPVLSQSEVYVKDVVPTDMFTGIGFHPSDLEAVMEEFGEVFKELSLPVYNLGDGTLVWPKQR